MHLQIAKDKQRKSESVHNDIADRKLERAVTRQSDVKKSSYFGTTFWNFGS